MDTMLSEEASLIGRYGECGVDWNYAEAGSISSSGDPASIMVVNALRSKLQNKTLCEIGPFVTRRKYVDGVAWRGFQADHEYMNARAATTYRPYEPKEHISLILFNKEEAGELERLRAGIDKYTQSWLRAFITGEPNPKDDAVWEEYKKGYEGLGLERLLEGVRESYARLDKK